MKEFTGKVAVITGAANGMGFGIAERCAQEGMKVVLAGINQDNLLQAEEKLISTGAELLCVQTDVSKLKDIENLAKKTLDTFGSVHLLVNNAGVGIGVSPWESSLSDWKWVLDVNLWGVIYGLHVFVPIMLKQGDACHIVNNASVAGLLPFHPSAPYQVSKHGVVALTENAYRHLAIQNANVKVSVLCTGWVKTRIMESARNRPSELGDETNIDSLDPTTQEWFGEIIQNFNHEIENGMGCEEVANQVFDAIRKEQLYILTHPDFNPGIQQRVENIIQQRNPVIE